ncbi:sigma-70 family RNA polymerase sigma factor [Rhodocytophaga aerolata]|uniref:Sigma-70 family RNA polymerase sigma factor n=1 Tax=Rhodocytophaga aerolata TaxID=455078 RepID=A0ABT8RBL8_9BACT|nr:sigma-70 family RNA polymerase sigma factor [Rhodocytophaga aerolata]MDO1448573.1 sigma-70 family RNA polymerase sigma factor [Rhodocytophaga aerolata]
MHTPLHDVELWNKFRKGDKEAYALLYKIYFRRLYNYGRKFTSDTECVKDCIQDLFTKLWRNKSTVGETSSVKNYLFCSFRRILIDKINHQKKDALSEEIDDSYTFEISLPYESLLINHQAEAERKEELARAIQALSSRQKEAIFLKFYESNSYEEVASIMTISTKSLYKLVAKAINTLRESVKKTYFLLSLLLLI